MVAITADFSKIKVADKESPTDDDLSRMISLRMIFSKRKRTSIKTRNSDLLTTSSLRYLDHAWLRALVTRWTIPGFVNAPFEVPEIRSPVRSCFKFEKLFGHTFLKFVYASLSPKESWMGPMKSKGSKSKNSVKERSTIARDIVGKWYCSYSFSMSRKR